MSLSKAFNLKVLRLESHQFQRPCPEFKVTVGAENRNCISKLCMIATNYAEMITSIMLSLANRFLPGQQKQTKKQQKLGCSRGFFSLTPPPPPPRPPPSFRTWMQSFLTFKHWLTIISIKPKASLHISFLSLVVDVLLKNENHKPDLDKLQNSYVLSM